MITEEILRPDEIVTLKLRALYEENGYSCFRMNKFEEYSLYANNKGFITGDKVLTFTNLDGRLMALKPDVTMSIIESTELSKGELQKFYYVENVYRENKNSTTFEEIPQVGLECIGSLDLDDVAEVLALACKTLDAIEDEGILSISNMTFVEELLRSVGVSEDDDNELYLHIIKLIRNKNSDGIRKVATAGGVSAENVEILCAIPSLYGEVEDVLERAGKYACNEAMKAALYDVRAICEKLNALGVMDMIQLDLSMLNEIDYYNGFIFRGHIKSSDSAVLGGGQYDRAMERFGKRGGGLGFALYLNEIARLDQAKAEESDMITIALPKGRLGDKVYKTLEAAGYECDAYNEKNRILVVENKARNVRYVLVKPSDVAVYVEHKAADIGIVGKDILLENEPDVYELKDLDIGKCRMCVAARKGFKDNRSRKLVVATKFVNVAKKYYQEQNRDIEIIKLNGSIELGPILGLSDVIVDIVETGSTIKENNLEIVTEFKQISARLICNKSSFEFKNAEISRIVEALSK